MPAIEEVYHEFMHANTLKNLSPETMRYYHENIPRFLFWCEEHGIKKVSKITKTTTSEYLLFLLQTVANVTSVNTYMRAVRRFIYYAAERNLTKSFTIDLVKDAYKIKPTFSDEEVCRMLATVRIDDEVSIIMLVLLSTGIRSRSLCELRVSDLDDNYINVNRTKNRKPLRLPITLAVAHTIREFATLHARHDLLFLNSNGGKFTRHSLAKHINTRLRMLGIEDYKSGVHIFRHTFGRIMSKNACPTVVLQKWFGHSDIRMTQRYVDLYGTDLEASVAMLPTRNFRCS